MQEYNQREAEVVGAGASDYNAWIQILSVLIIQPGRPGSAKYNASILLCLSWDCCLVFPLSVSLNCVLPRRRAQRASGGEIFHITQLLCLEQLLLILTI